MASTIAGHTFGYLHRCGVEDAIADLAAHGLSAVEVTTAPPHLHPPGFDRAQRRRLAAHLEAHGMRCISLNPGFVDLNVISLNPELR